MKRFLVLLSVLTFGNVQQISEAKESLVKEYAFQEYGGQFKLDRSLVNYVNEMTENIATVVDPNRSYSSIILNDMEPDAWILSDGTLGLTRGLLELLDEEKELAALVSQQLQLAKAFLSKEPALVSTKAVSLRRYKGGGYALGQANKTLNFIVGQEFSITEMIIADRWAQDAIAQIGYHPDAFVTLLEKLSKVPEGNGLVKRQPWSDERLHKVKENVARLENRMGPFSTKSSREKFTLRKVALAETNEAYTFAETGKGRVSWNAEKMFEKAMDVMPKKWGKEPYFNFLSAELLADRDRCEEALKELDEATSRHGASAYYYFLLKADCHLMLRNFEKAQAEYLRSNLLLPNSRATEALAELALLRDDHVSAKSHFIALMSSPGYLKKNAKDSFVRLDAFDNPGFYFPVFSKVRVHDKKFYAVLSNQAGFSIKGADLSIKITVNGQEFKKLVQTGPILKDSEAIIYPGWEFSETDKFANLDVKVLKIW